MNVAFKPQLVTRAASIALDCGQAKKAKVLESNVDQLGPFLHKYTHYETGIRPTALGYIYGVQKDLEECRRLLEVSEAHHLLQDVKDRSAFHKLRDLWTKGFIDANEGVFQ